MYPAGRLLGWWTCTIMYASARMGGYAWGMGPNRRSDARSLSPLSKGIGADQYEPLLDFVVVPAPALCKERRVAAPGTLTHTMTQTAQISTFELLVSRSHNCRPSISIWPAAKVGPDIIKVPRNQLRFAPGTDWIAPGTEAVTDATDEWETAMRRYRPETHESLKET
ncbi:uncharacterized protein MKK02DRAFT_27761 [Dioszegia hungarica]|uniref:Uncharacterized protein n=1 Tax=Dioszegia hungarica TaxID=4972 RepID=A0AA38LUX7_9TREE|nr:uncharacterized protein MKK02DRAFT_27761 [Dioszegia hungarica]KAI9634561.1 hypothetical protein MKK02DRAFT_27761 [Dioszegia hungarica]